MGSGETLAGIWQGLYSYPRILPAVSFIATLIESATAVTGSTHEAHRKTGALLCAILCGRRAGSLLRFVKSYDPNMGGYGADVLYEGTVTEDGREIEGRWMLASSWSGRFLMIRGAREGGTIARKKFARA